MRPRLPLQVARPLWHDNYRSMSERQLMLELGRIARNPHLADPVLARKAMIADELALRVGRGVIPTPTQAENDLAALGVPVDPHQWDGSPVEPPPVGRYPGDGIVWW